MRRVAVRGTKGVFQMADFRYSRALVVTEEYVNHRRHVAYEKYFVLFQEARIGYLAQFGYRSNDSDGFGLIAAEARCVYQKEIRSGDSIAIGCRIRWLKPKAFEMAFQITRDGDVCASGETTYLCFNYAENRVAPFPDRFVRCVRAHEQMA